MTELNTALTSFKKIYEQCLLRQRKIKSIVLSATNVCALFWTSNVHDKQLTIEVVWY